MRQLILICHNDHLISGSVSFLEELLAKEFNVQVLPYDNGLKYIEITTKIYPDALFLLLQTEFLAPWLVSKGYNVAAFPMYDACSMAGDYYFRLLNGTYLFNFSKALHKKCVDAGVVSYQVNYYPTQQHNDSETDSKKEQLFYWLRRPNSSLSEPFISQLFSPYVDKIHIHDRPDNYTLANSVNRVSDNFVSTSTWFKEREKLHEIMASSKYFLAPRESEGIGMAFLEAMSMGCIVFANRNSTHDQYIYHGHNGFLIDFETRDTELIHKQIEEAFSIIGSGKPISENARQFMLEGQKAWELQSEKVLQTMLALSKAKGLKPYSKISRFKSYLLVYVYFKNRSVYSFLLRILNFLSKFARTIRKKYGLLYLAMAAKKSLVGRR